MYVLQSLIPQENTKITGIIITNLQLRFQDTHTVNEKRMIKGKIKVIYLYKVFSLYIIRDYCTLKS